MKVEPSWILAPEIRLGMRGVLGVFMNTAEAVRSYTPIHSDYAHENLELRQSAVKMLGRTRVLAGAIQILAV